jgi:hypothetical protein
MKVFRKREPRMAVPESEGAVRAAQGWSFGAVDAAMAAVSLTVALAACAPFAIHLRKEVRKLDSARIESMQRTRMHRLSVQRNESRREALTQFRREVNRYVAEVEARPMIPWTTVVGELSRRRPQGLWTTRLSGNGQHFRAQVATHRTELVPVYTQSLRESPYFEFATLPAGMVPANRTQVVGRVRGE